jgi:hypothetical protein
MVDYAISIIRPPNYIHSDCFFEVAETLQYGLRGLGHKAVIVENSADPSMRNIFLGAHMLSDTIVLPGGAIIYNLEQLGNEGLKEAYYNLACKYQIWDYSRLNIAKWRERDCIREPLLVEIGYVPELRRIVSHPQQDIDVLFYGSLNEHRKNVLQRLLDSGVKVHYAFSVYGRERDALIARSKIVLNIHHYVTNLFEIVRVSYLLANSKAVVSEDSPDIGDYREAVAVFPHEKLVDGCLSLLRDEARRKDLEKRGFEFFSQQHAVQILSHVALESESRERFQASAKDRPAAQA